MDPQKLLQELLKISDDDKDITPKQAKIIQAAIEIFAEKGYASASTSEIAKRAGVAEGTIFRHYKTKKELLLSIVSPMIIKFAAPFFAETFIRQVFKDHEDKGFEELLRKLIQNRYEFVKNNVPLLKIVLQEMAFHPEIQQAYKQVFTEKVLPKFKKMVEYYQDKGELRNDFSVDTTIRLVINTAVGFMVTRFIVMPDYPWDDEKELENTIQYIKDGIFS
ncbi:MAG: TetR/AcrR family transcriptional regulator [Bacillaceae bacterium]|nr:TetR/AcrR family transcriptional regulator [Bacillaceae bacterium]